MNFDYTNMSTSDLVDLLALKTQKFTQLMTDNNLNDEYQECKTIIQQILTQMELRKETLSANPNDKGAI